MDSTLGKLEDHDWSHASLSLRVRSADYVINAALALDVSSNEWTSDERWMLTFADPTWSQKKRWVDLEKATNCTTPTRINETSYLTIRLSRSDWPITPRKRFRTNQRKMELGISLFFFHFFTSEKSNMKVTRITFPFRKRYPGGYHNSYGRLEWPDHDDKTSGDEFHRQSYASLD